jgi:uncharacterized membrane protein YhaH (DUF805 family)
MTLVAAVRSCFRNYFRFSGRASRSEFWKFMLFFLLLNLAALILNSLLFGPELIRRAVTTVALDGSQSTEVYAIREYNTGWIGTLIVLACLVPLLSAGWRRLHDTDAAGWWLLVPFVFFFAVVAAVAVATLGPAELWAALKATGNVRVNLSGGTAVILLLTAIAPFLLLVVRLCRRSNPHPNRYGPPPSEVTP